MSEVVTLDAHTTVDGVQKQAGEDLRLLLGRGKGRIDVQWDAEAKVTSTGSLVFFCPIFGICGTLQGFV